MQKDGANERHVNGFSQLKNEKENMAGDERA